MSLSSLAPIDNIDDRTEIFYLLTRLSPQQRCQFLFWAMNSVNAEIRLRHDPPHVLVQVTNPTGETFESFMDLMGLIASWGLDRERVLAELERRVRRLAAAD